MSNLYNNIRRRRIELGMSQDDLAQKMGYTSRSTIAKIESGVNDIPQSKIVAFANALKTTPGALMGWDDDDSEQVVETSQTMEEYQQLYEKLDLEDKAEIRGTMKQMLKADKYKINTNDTPSLSALRLINNRSDDDGYHQAASNLKYKKKSK